MFGPIAGLVDFSGARVVVDVAGGNGALLGGLLSAVPHLRGVLLERPHVIEAARTTLAASGCAARCEFVAGDFTDAVPGGGDVYILSRVLHDWDDEDCLAILRRCAAAMPEHATLLIIERLLLEDGSPSLATAWDLHMMCNVGGRERTASHYRRLLHDAGVASPASTPSRGRARPRPGPGPPCRHTGETPSTGGNSPRRHVLRTPPACTGHTVPRRPRSRSSAAWAAVRSTPATRR